jgi:hypothetical protein
MQDRLPQFSHVRFVPPRIVAGIDVVAGALGRYMQFKLHASSPS